MKEEAGSGGEPKKFGPVEKEDKEAEVAEYEEEECGGVDVFVTLDGVNN